MDQEFIYYYDNGPRRTGCITFQNLARLSNNMNKQTGPGFAFVDTRLQVIVVAPRDQGITAARLLVQLLIT